MLAASRHAAHRRITLPVASVRDVPDDAELTRRLVSLISLLGIYAVGLVVVAFVSDGPDIGVLLAALFGHAVWTAARYFAREQRERRTVVAAGERGVVVFARRARFIRYRDITHAAANDGALTLRVRAGAHAGPDVVLRWTDDTAARVALLHRIDGRVRRDRTAPPVAAFTSASPRRSGARPEARIARAAESLARVSARVAELAPKSSTHLPVPT